MSTFSPSTELDLIERITHTECGQCNTRTEVDPEQLVDGGNESVDDLMSLDGPCGCDDPLPNFYIVTTAPLFGDTGADDSLDDGGRVVSRGEWEYQVDHDLAERLGVSG